MLTANLFGKTSLNKSEVQPHSTKQLTKEFKPPLGLGAGNKLRPLVALFREIIGGPSSTLLKIQQKTQN